MGDLHAPVMGAVVLASATAWIVLRMLLGNHPLFKVPQYQLVSPAEFAVYAVLGVAGGLVSATFAKLLLGMRERFLRFPLKMAWLHPVVGGLLVGLMGWFVPQVLGVGYGFVGDALNGKMAFNLMLMLVVLKLLAVTTSYASGNAGGIFGPALFIGAMLGGTVGTVDHNSVRVCGDHCQDENERFHREGSPRLRSGAERSCGPRTRGVGRQPAGGDQRRGQRTSAEWHGCVEESDFL